jgi:DNA invertase Pin-like site-specific DNA recombinase
VNATRGFGGARTPEERERPPVIGYVLVESGELAAATRAIGDWCEQRGWPLATVVHDHAGHRREGLEHALGELRAHRAAGLVVTRLGDLADSVAELAPLLRWFAEGEAFVIALDCELDDAPGELTAGAVAAICDWERDRAARDDPELS